MPKTKQTNRLQRILPQSHHGLLVSQSQELTQLHMLWVMQTCRCHCYISHLKTCTVHSHSENRQECNILSILLFSLIPMFLLSRFKWALFVWHYVVNTNRLIITMWDYNGHRKQFIIQLSQQCTSHFCFWCFPENWWMLHTEACWVLLLQWYRQNRLYIDILKCS